MIAIDVTDLAAANKKSVIRVLHVDDDSSIREISKQILMDMNTSFEFDSACCVDEAFKKLATGHYDVVVSDYEMPQKDGLQFLTELRKQNTEIPFILFTDKSREEVAIKALNLGADGYFNKQGSPETVYGELAHGIHQASKRAETKSALEEAELRFRTVADFAYDWVYWLAPDGHFVYMSPSCEKITGYSVEEFIREPQLLNRIVSSQDAELFGSHFDLMKSKKEHIVEFQITTKNGEARWISHACIPVFGNNGEWLGRRATNRDISKHKKAEEALHNSEERLHSLVDSMDDLVFVLDLNGTFQNYYQPSLKRNLYVPPEAFIGKHFRDVLPPHVTELLQAAMKRIETSDEVQEFDYYLEMNGEKSWYNAKLSSMKDHSGHTTSIVNVIRNITERRQAEDSLEKERVALDCIIDSSPIIIAYKDKEGKFIRVNKTFAEALKISNEQFLGKTVFDFYSAKIAQGMTNDDSEVLESGRPKLGIIEQYESPSGVRWLQTDKVPTFDEKGTLTGLVVFAQDITEPKQSEEALLRAEERFRLIFEGSADGILAADVKTRRFAFANPRICEITGYSLEELLELSIDEIHPEKDLPYVLDQFTKQMQVVTLSTNISVLRKDESVVYCDINSKRMKIDGQEYLVGFFRDITDRKVLEAKVDNYSKHLKSMVELRTVQLKDANDRVVKSERLAAIGELAGMVGHDLRNPLAGIKNATYFLKKKGTTIPEAQAKEILETIDTCIDHSDKIINDLLDYAREMHLELTKYAAHALADEAIRMIQVPDRIQIVNHVQEKIWIWVNRDKMMRVFLNLIKNAVDAMPDKGTLTISSCKTRERVEIVFADTGTGIPEETLKKIFTPLFTTKAQGMGFGLAICKRVIEAHGGTITVKTAVNKGTTFTITLPIKPKSQPAKKPKIQVD